MEESTGLTSQNTSLTSAETDRYKGGAGAVDHVQVPTRFGVRGLFRIQDTD